jgi:hypothetical protein
MFPVTSRINPVKKKNKRLRNKLPGNGSHWMDKDVAVLRKGEIHEKETYAI